MDIFKAFGTALLNSTTFSLYALTGEYHFRNRKYNEAYRYFYKAVIAQPYNPDVLYNCALCLYNLGRYGEAMNYVNKAIRLNPDKTLYKQLEGNIKKRM